MEERNRVIPLPDGTTEDLWGIKNIKFLDIGGVEYIFYACSHEDPFIRSETIEISFTFSIDIYSWKLTGESSIMGTLPISLNDIKEEDRSLIYEIENSDYRNEIYRNSCELQGDARAFIVISNEDVLEVIANNIPKITVVNTSKAAIPSFPAFN